MGDFGPAEKVKADDIAAVFREEIRADVEALKAKGVHPTLVGFLGTGDVSAKKYSEWTMKACEADGIKFEVREVSPVFLMIPYILKRRGHRRRGDAARFDETRFRQTRAAQHLLANVSMRLCMRSAVVSSSSFLSPRRCAALSGPDSEGGSEAGREGRRERIN